MNAQYLGWLIREQIDRAHLLKAAIPGKPRHVALEHLAASCKDALDEQASLLDQYRAMLDGSGRARAARILKAVKRCARTIGEIEGYGMPPLHCQSEQAVFLNDVLSTMHREVGLSFRCPAVSCTSNDYYFSHLPTNTVYVPLSEAEFLLHMPDFYHELGHTLLGHLQQGHPDHEQEYGSIRVGLASTIDAIGRHYSHLAGGMGRDAASARVQDGMEWAWMQWTGSWIHEAFCDLFALFAVGPAYAYSNLHLVSKLDMNIYELDTFAKQDHPSGDARMRLLDAGLRMLGHGREADHVRGEWSALAQLCGDPPPEHSGAFPSSLLGDIAVTVLPTFSRAGLRGYADDKRAQGGVNGATVASLLNDAWTTFWSGGNAPFRGLETTMVAKLASITRMR